MGTRGWCFESELSRQYPVFTTGPPRQYPAVCYKAGVPVKQGAATYVLTALTL